MTVRLTLDKLMLRVYYNSREKQNKGVKMIFHYQENPAHPASPFIQRIDNDTDWQFHLEMMNEMEEGTGDFNPEIRQLTHNCIMTDILVSY